MAIGERIGTTRRAVLATAGLGLSAIVGGDSAASPFPVSANAAARALFAEGRYLPLWRLARSGREPDLIDYLQQVCAYVGDEAAALVKAGAAGIPTPDLAGAAAAPALAEIVRASAGRRLVMLNEAHTASRHRMFLAQVLRALKAEGFTHLAAETFTNLAEAAASVEMLGPGDSLTFQHGTYIADPVFAEAVREALDTGYQLVAYEQRPDQRGASDDLAAQIAAREQAQAENFVAALRRWPKGRFVVFVGYSHLDERQDAHPVPWFAARLRELAGLDPLTIGQAQSGSFGPHAKDNSATTAVLQKFALREPSIVQRDGAPWAVSAWPGDLTVFHPALPDVRGRPGWLAADPARRWAPVRFAASKADRLLQAIREADIDPAIPADQIIVPPGAKSAWLLLRPGRYRLRLETDGGFESLKTVSVDLA